jgi:hypothetical protein
MEGLQLSPELPVLFIGSTALVVFLLLRAFDRVARLAVIIISWVLLQGILASTGFFTVTDTLPPRMVAAIGPPLLAILLISITRSGRVWMERAELRVLTILHIVRIPVELGLHGLYTNGLVPELMTYEGRNFDIFSGLTAPLMAMIAFRSGKVNVPLLLGWNIICLLLLLNIVVHGILSVPSPFQQFAFDQPNVGLLYFPFEWLPSVIVPIVLLAHIAALRQLILYQERSVASPVSR